ncbi:acetoacetate decarboxylase [Xylogone sp. PMI_703]|nr:acetoacetate decarboxylase [Xylogone sp. PMI_703]
MPFGTLKTETVDAIPPHSLSYSAGKTEFSDLEAPAYQLFYVSRRELEIEDEPRVTHTLFNWRFSTIGAYTEFMSQIEVTYRGEKQNYTLELILDNDGAIYLGRKRYGLPKVFGKVVFDPSATVPIPYGMLVGHVERPIGRPIMHFGFKPEAKLHGLTSLPGPGERIFSLRVVPSPTVGQPPAIREFVSLEFNIKEAEVWTGAGSIQFSAAFDFDVSHKLPIVR